MKRLNLIPKQNPGNQPLRASLKIFRTRGFKTALIAAVVLSLIVIPQFLLNQQKRWGLTKAKSQLEEAKAKLSRLQARQLNLSKDREAVLKKKSLAEEKLEYLKMSEINKPAELSQALVYLPTLIPNEIWINKLSINQEEMVINGSTLNNQAVSGFMDNLNNSSKFKNSNFNFAKKNEVGDTAVYNFEISTHPAY
ncbi:MAG: PilN domain-containing protein [Candidatus Omnitrophota bacterium]